MVEKARDRARELDADDAAKNPPVRASIVPIRARLRWISSGIGSDRSPDEALESLDSAATVALDKLWPRPDADMSKVQTSVGSRAMARLRPPLMPDIVKWTKDTERLSRLIWLLDQQPPIPLPRTVCVVFMKTADLAGEPAFAEADFERSLELAGFSRSESESLIAWLAQPDNQKVIAGMDVRTFAAALVARGVSAVPSLRNRQRWHGSIADNLELMDDQA
jgi:hypothetical protein